MATCIFLNIKKAAVWEFQFCIQPSFIFPSAKYKYHFTEGDGERELSRMDTKLGNMVERRLRVCVGSCLEP